MNLAGKRILLIVTGGIAAYKTPELVRLLVKAGAQVRCILTKAGEQFVTRLTLESVSGQRVFTDLWDLDEESEIGHIKLSRQADVVLVAPATANSMAKLAAGLADDLPSTCLLATDKPILMAPAMNPQMWAHAATQDNVKTLVQRGVKILAPDVGDMACGETGQGRMREPATLVQDVCDHFAVGLLSGKHVVVTSGPTFEPIDPVRFIGNRSSGKQGYAIAQACLNAGATVTLITGPVNIQPPFGAKIVQVETAEQMYAATLNELPADVAVCAAAVADWRPTEINAEKLKKAAGEPNIKLVTNPDILKHLGHLPIKQRPVLVIGFAAETNDLAQAAAQKLQTKKADMILANSVANGAVFGCDDGHVVVYPGAVDWGAMSKAAIADKLVVTIAKRLKEK